MLTIYYYYIEMSLSGSFHLLLRLDSSDIDLVDSGSTGMGAGAGASEIKLEKVAILNYVYTKLLDLTSMWNTGVAASQLNNVNPCFVLEFGFAGSLFGLYS